MNAPERIWACPPSIFDDCDVWKMQKGGDDETEYVRADLYDAQSARIAELEAALRKCETEIDGYIRQEYPLDNPLHERYRYRDLSSNPARAALSTPHSTMKETE